MKKFIDNPLHAYKEDFSKKIEELANETFERLIKETNTDVELNQRTTTEYYKKDAISNKLSNIIKIERFFAWFFIVSVVVLGLLSYYMQEIMIYTILGGVISLIVSILLFVSASRREDSKLKLDSEIDILRSNAYEQTTALKESFDIDLPIQLFNKITPNIKIDSYLTKNKHDYIFQCADILNQHVENKSILGCYSGYIGENSFLITKERTQTMQSVEYHGSLQIYWETLEKDSNGRYVKVNHTQTLYATSWHDAPVFEEYVYTYFGCPIGENLHFSRKPFGVRYMSDNKLNRKIKSTYKNYCKKAEKNLGGEKELVLLVNEEFESLFGAIDRNQDVEFRLLFTPLAQQNMVELIKDREILGDQFEFIKKGKYNLVYSYVNQNLVFNGLSSKHYYSIDVKIIKEKFVKFINSFFKDIYLGILPILNIPEYQQAKPEIKFEDFEKNLQSQKDTWSIYEVEARARLDTDYLPEQAKTLCITKAFYTENPDLFRVYSYGFDKEIMIDYIPVKGGDGFYHNVPVQWIKYNKVVKENEFIPKNNKTVEIKN